MLAVNMKRQRDDVGHADEEGAGEFVERFEEHEDRAGHDAGGGEGQANGEKVRSADPPRLRAASSGSRSTAANAAAVIHTAKTSPCTVCTRITPNIVPFSLKS